MTAAVVSAGLGVEEKQPDASARTQGKQPSRGTPIRARWLRRVSLHRHTVAGRQPQDGGDGGRSTAEASPSPPAALPPAPQVVSLEPAPGPNAPGEAAPEPAPAAPAPTPTAPDPIPTAPDPAAEAESPPPAQAPTEAAEAEPEQTALVAVAQAVAPSPSPPGSKYWGAWIGSQLTGTEAPWDMGAVSKFEQLAGKPVSTVHFSSPFADCSSSPCEFYGFQGAAMDKIRAHGAIPFFSWGSQSTPASLNQPDFQLADVIEGRHDAYIRRFAEEARDWGHPFFLRFNWEMNGNWFAWMEGVNGNQPGQSVAAWRHVHDIFTQVGATNATWVWCPNVDPNGNLRDLASLYPGDAYVDWTGLDGYNWGTNPARNDRWLSFDQLYRSSYEYITKRLAPSKPLAIAEVGSSEYGGSKSAWIEDALGAVAGRYPQVRAMLWFEKFDDGMDWPIESSGGATAAFAAGIANPVFAGNSYAGLAASAIPAPN